MSSDLKQNKRRLFLKKVTYAAPVLTVLGQMTKPTVADAESSIDPPPFGASSSRANNRGEVNNDPFASQFDK